MSDVKTRVGRLEHMATAADDRPADLPVIVHAGGETIEMTSAEWVEYHATHPGDYITIRAGLAIERDTTGGK